MACTIVCIQPSPSQAHCGSCHVTLSGPTLFDAHRIGPVAERVCRDPRTMTDRGLPLRRDASGVWRSAAARPATGSVAPQTAQKPSVVGRDDPGPQGADGGRFWGERPAHPTCVDVTRFGSPPGSEWMCGPGCPVADGGGIGASIVILDEPGGAA